MTTNEILLAADTSTRHCAVALCRQTPEGLETMAQSCVDRHKLHAERLLDGVHWLLEAVECTLEQVTCLAIASGPGSFTGLRVGVATWKGLAFSLGLPLVAVPTLDAMARLVPVADGIVVPLLDARMKEVFGAAYRFTEGRRTKVISECVCPVQTLLAKYPLHEGPVSFLGDGALRYGAAIREHLPQAYFVSAPCGTPRADVVAEEAWAIIGAGGCTDPALAAPRYLRASQAEQAREARLEQAARQQPA